MSMPRHPSLDGDYPAGGAPLGGSVIRVAAWNAGDEVNLASRTLARLEPSSASRFLLIVDCHSWPFLAILGQPFFWPFLPFLAILGHCHSWCQRLLEEGTLRFEKYSLNLAPRVPTELILAGEVYSGHRSDTRLAF